MSILQSLQTLVATGAGLGIGTSGVKKIAEHKDEPDRQEEAQGLVVTTSFWTGLIATLLLAVMCLPISYWLFDSKDYWFGILLIGLSIVFGVLSTSFNAVLQGHRKLPELAKCNIISAIVSTIVCLAIYWIFGASGIPSAIAVGVVIAFFTSYFYYRPLKVTRGPSKNRALLKEVIELGLPFMVSALLTALVTFLLRAEVNDELGFAIAGVYHASWMLSGLFAKIVFTALGSDFFPRLSAAAKDRGEVRKLVNEQIEIGVLISFPGFIILFLFAPFSFLIIYSEEFLVGTTVLRWFALGVLVQTVGWPIGIIQRAVGAVRWLYFTQTLGPFLVYTASLFLLYRFGLDGLGMAFIGSQLVLVTLSIFIARKLTDFSMSKYLLVLIGVVIVAAILSALIVINLDGASYWLVSTLVVSVCILGSLKCLVGKIDDNHMINKILRKIPGLRTFLGLS